MIPFPRRLDINCVVKIEPCWIVGLELIKLIFKEDVLNSAIAEDQREMSAIISIKSSLEHLITRCDTSASSDHPDSEFLLNNLSLNQKFAKAFVSKLTEGPANEHFGASLQSLEVLCHHTTVRELGVDIAAINFYNEVNISIVSHVAYGSVLSLNKLA